MLHPSQFQVNEAWIFFQLNEAPVVTESDGDFNLFALMDAASCFILSTAPVPATQDEPSTLQVKRLMKDAHAHKRQLPNSLFIPIDQPAKCLTAEAERRGIVVARVPNDDLQPFVGEAREGFSERFGGGRTQ